MKIGAALLGAFLAFLGCTSAAEAVTAVVTPTFGPPTTTIAVKGTGFNASTLVDVFFDTTDVALATSNATGAVNYTLAVPADAQPGVHWVTLSERRTFAAAQKAFIVRANWAQTGYGSAKRSNNPFENTINTSNVSQLTKLWSKPLDGFSNSKPVIVSGNVIVVRDADQVIRAFDTTGKMLWTATTPFSMFPDSLTPVASPGRFFFADLNGNVIAYPIVCRTDGGTCIPSWTTNIGSRVEGGLTFYLGHLYAPAADGTVHVLNPTTGAQLTGIVVSANALTSWIAFAADGAGYVAAGTSMARTVDSTGSSSFDTYSGTLSAPVVGADTAYATESDSLLREVQFGWTAAISGSGCQTPPAYGSGSVFAAGCTSLGAYDPGTGSARWTIPTSGSTEGLAYANGVLYACISDRLAAYDASYGGKLWSGGFCSAAPVVVNGTLYSTFATLSAYTLNASQAEMNYPRPSPYTLKRTISAER